MGNYCQNNPTALNQVDTDEGQSHLMVHWKNLPSDNKRRTFEQELNKVNVHDAINIYKRHSRTSTIGTSLASSTESDHTCGLVEYRQLPQEKLLTLSQVADQKQQLDQIGYQAIANGEVAVFIMAGSHNPQLNIDIPLGVYDIGLDSACTIFHILMARLIKLNFNCKVPESKRVKVYIMTSMENKNQIKSYFKAKDYFGYGSSNVFFFSQQAEPVVDEHGKIVLQAEDKIYLCPRGNGVIYSQIKDKKLIQHLSNQGIKYTFFCPINNLLLKISDPTSLGHLIKQKKQVVATCFQSKEDCFGYFGMDISCKHVKVYEQKFVSLHKKWANTGSCVMTLEFLKKVVENNTFIEGMHQNLHDVTKIAHVFNITLNTKITQKCLFFQSFYHEAFQLANQISIIQIDPELQFAPIKHGSNGKYSLIRAKQALWKWHRKLIQKLGIEVSGEGHVQIHPILTYEGEDMQKVMEQKKIIGSIKLPAYIE